MIIHASDRHDTETDEGLMPEPIALSTLLARVAIELEGLASAVERLHPLAAALGDSSALRPDPDTLRAVQSVDPTEQTLRALARFVNKVAAATPSDCFVDTRADIAEITLADLAARLMGLKAEPVEGASYGDCEIF